MPDHDHVRCEGEVTDVFAHRFVLRTRDGTLLADIGPKGAEHLVVRPGAKVVIEGERKPSEIKVHRIALDGGPSVDTHHPKKHGPGHGPHDHHPHADPNVAADAARAAGYTCLGAPRRKPKHFEQLARKGGRPYELHIELDGHIRKEKPVHADDPKWSGELGYSDAAQGTGPGR